MAKDCPYRLAALVVLCFGLVTGEEADESSSCERVNVVPSSEACAWVVTHCESDALVPYMQLYYCHVSGQPWVTSAAVAVLLLAELVLLFRVLGSTAEDFLSPSLTQLSQEMGLPPRFAGVTLLALGNGAPDLSSSIVAVKAGNYDMALGAQIGSGCFVGCVVAGCIVLQGAGVRARGALVRDVCAYMIAVAVVVVLMAAGTFAFWSCLLLLCMYAAYVASVLCADVWHRTSHRWRGAKPSQHQPLLRGDAREGSSSRGRAAVLQAGSAPVAEVPSLAGSSVDEEDDGDDEASGTEGEEDDQGGETLSRHQLMAMSGKEYSLRAWAAIAHSSSFRKLSSLIGGGRGSGAGSGHASSERGTAGGGVGGGDAISSPPPARGGAGAGLLQSPLSVDSGAGIELQQSLDTDAAAHWQQQQQLGAGSSVQLSSRQPSCSDLEHGRQQQQGYGQQQVESPRAPPSLGSPHVLPQELQWHHTPPPWQQQQQRVPSPFPQGSAGATARVELRQRLWEQLLAGAGRVFVSPAVVCFGPALAAAEWPLTCARRAVVPLVEADAYDRTWFLTAMALSPPFVVLYVRQLSLWWLLGSACVGAVLCALSWLGVRGRGSAEPPFWGLGTSFPIGAAIVAVYGFLIAAMWVDLLATELVGLLQFLGILLSVDHTVLGLTVLAMGNSMGDLSSNMAMARRGLANMAITACFAGPLFNLLVGMGAGFLGYFSKVGGTWTTSVHLPAVVLPGAILVLANCAGILIAGKANGGHVPRRYGWCCLVMYSVYMAAAVGMSLALR